MMVKLLDRTVLGIVAGLIGGFSSIFMDVPLYKKAPDIKTWSQRARGLTVSKKYYNDPFSWTVGYITSLSLSAVLGIGQSYFLSMTGKDYRIVKSTGYALITWMGLHGLGKRISDPDSSPQASLSSLASNLINALITTEVITRLGDNRLFTGEIPLTPRMKHSDPSVKSYIGNNHEEVTQLGKSKTVSP